MNSYKGAETQQTASVVSHTVINMERDAKPFMAPSSRAELKMDMLRGSTITRFLGPERV